MQRTALKLASRPDTDDDSGVENSPTSANTNTKPASGDGNLATSMATEIKMAQKHNDGKGKQDFIIGVVTTGAPQNETGDHTSEEHSKQSDDTDDVEDVDRYAEAPNISKDVGLPQINKEAVDDMNNNFSMLEEKYSWMDSDNKVLLIFWFVYYTITGFLVVLCLLLPLVLFHLLLMLFFFFIYILTCGAWCFGKFQSFMEFYRTFVGTQRINLCLVSMKKRGIFWHIWNRIILFYQNIEVILYTRKENSPFGICKIYQGLFGNNFPFLEGIAISDNYNHSWKEITSFNNRRLGWGVGVQYHSDITTYCLPQVLDSNDSRHLIARDLTFIALDWSDMPENKRNYDTNNLVSEIYKRMSAINKNTKQINEAYYPGFLWYYICNGELLSGQDLAYVGDDMGAMSITNPKFTHFLFGNNALLRDLYKRVCEHAQLFQRVAPSEKLRKIERYCAKIGLSRNYGLMIVAINIIFAGGRGNTRKLIKMISNCQEKEKPETVEKYWKVIENDIKNDTNFFVLESLRFVYLGLCVFWGLFILCLWRSLLWSTACVLHLTATTKHRHKKHLRTTQNKYK